MFMKKYLTFILGALLTCSLMFGVMSCGVFKDSDETSEKAAEGLSEESDEDLIVVGFSQLGAESNWRSANTESMRETFTKENGYELIFEDGQQKQSNQITSIRRFIQQEVDYIVLAPVTETGWDTVLSEARDAGIPVIIVDRMVDVEDDSLFTAWVGSNFELEGKKAAQWLYEYCSLKEIAPEDIHIVDIQGTIGASAQIGRTNGLEDAAASYGWDLLAYADGDFTELGGKEAMKGLLREYDNINVVYCENDNSALGAIEALENAGYTVGSDIANGEIMVISFDGVNEEALSLVEEGKISVEGECNPLHGPRVEAIIQALENGETPEKYTYVEESIYSAFPDITKLEIDCALYEVSILKK